MERHRCGAEPLHQVVPIPTSPRATQTGLVIVKSRNPDGCCGAHLWPPAKCRACKRDRRGTRACVRFSRPPPFPLMSFLNQWESRDVTVQQTTSAGTSGKARRKLEPTLASRTTLLKNMRRLPVIRGDCYFSLMCNSVRLHPARQRHSCEQRTAFSMGCELANVNAARFNNWKVTFLRCLFRR